MPDLMGRAPMQLSVLDPRPHEPLPKLKSSPAAAPRIDRPRTSTASSGWSHAQVAGQLGQHVSSRLYTRICDLCEILIRVGPRPWAMDPAAFQAFTCHPSSPSIEVMGGLCKTLASRMQGPDRSD